MIREDGVNICFSPTISQLAEIEEWVKEESKKGGGFYCNWPLIRQSHSRNQMAIVEVESNAIGFVIWYETGRFGSIELIVIRASHRKKGYGRLLIEHLYKYFLNKNIYVVKLLCSPPSTEKIWKKLGYTCFPDIAAFGCFNVRENIHLYKAIVPSANLSTCNPEVDELIELWDDAPNQTISNQATWVWPLYFMDGTRELVKPIIWPANEDWKIRWVKGGNVMRECKIKYWLDQRNISFGDFLIIDKML